MSIRIYNTLSRTKEPLETTVPGQVGIYLCGPTVYKPSHIGHMVGPVIFDTVKRFLVYSGYDVCWVVNITDVDDKLIAEAQRRGTTMSAVAEEMTEDYLQNIRALGVDGIDHLPKATDNIPGIIEFIKSLVDQGFAYAADGDIYFEVRKDAEYGKLSHRSLESMEGDGGEAVERKKDRADFALWKGAKEDEPSWDSPWGPGRPGWHIECSAMSRALLGETFEIHGGGIDLIFPHHENEIAQSECCHGKPMARFWMHNGLMQASHEVGKLGGRKTRGPIDEDHEAQAAAKISKSTGAQPFRELLEQHDAETIRFFLLATHYRRPIDFSHQRIEEVRAGLDTFYRFFKRYDRTTGDSFYVLPVLGTREEGDVEASGQRMSEEMASTEDGTTGDDATTMLRSVGKQRSSFLAAMEDDFNTGGAIGELFELVRSLNKFCDDAGLDNAPQVNENSRLALRTGTVVLRELASILGLFGAPREDSTSGQSDTLVTGLMELLVELRGLARENKDFPMADRIRDGLGDLGVILEDRPGGTEWSVR